MKMRPFFAGILLLLSSGAFAQSSPKVCWIESAELLAVMPERVKADSDLAKYTRSFQEVIDAMIKDYQAKGADYQAHVNDKSWSDAVKDVKLKEIQDLQSRIESTQQSAQEKIQQKKQDLLTPILDKAAKAVQDVAKEKGYDYVFDKSGGTLLFGRDGDNILPLVKAKLGIK